MKAGQLDNKIVIEARTSVKTGRGTPTPTWAEHAKAWADVEHLPGRKNFEGSKENPVGVKRFTLRYVDGVTSAMRVKWDSRYFYIYDIAIIGRREGLEIYAEENSGQQ